ncbi:J domain-containing protein [Paeniglutamicibacter sp. MACA_103]|uniref:J domain-containing protein n=1 Tax=Paeniglutamicibacter sp. MACA_103 TaxID=3377337 RepID=UPI0038956E83
MNGASHYAVLGVAVSAPLAVIRAAHRAQMREHHPDAATGSEAKAKALNEALRVLQDAKLRAAYDATLGLGIAAGSGTRGDAAFAGAAEDTRLARGAGAAEAERRVQSARVQARARAAAADAIARERERDESRARREAAARANARWFARQDPTRLAGHDVFARSDIRLASMGWHNRDYPPLHLRQAPRGRSAAPRMLARLLLGIVTVLACVPAAHATAGSRAPAATALLLLLLVPVPALLGGWARARGAPGPWPAVPYILFLAYAGGILLPALAGGPGANPVPIAWLAAYLLGIETVRATAGRGHPRGGALLDEAEIRERTLWECGDGDGTDGPRIEEVLTGQLLARLDRLPGSRTIHPLAWSGDGLPRVGHGVLCGNRLALLDSVNCPGGQYLWWHGRVVGRLPGRAPAELENNFPQALQGYRRMFPELQVRGWTVFHSSDGNEMLTNNQAPPELPRLVTADMALREVGDWLAAGEPHVVDRRALSRLVLGPGRGPGRGDRPPGAPARRNRPE